MKALDDVYIRVGEGEAVGLVGESGSGKSTLLRCLMGLEKPDSGLHPVPTAATSSARVGRDLRAYRQSVQMVFQDPAGSLNPRMTVEDLIGEGILVHKRAPTAPGTEGSCRVVADDGRACDPEDMKRYRRSFSGGQLQRIAIARALAVEPALLVCDEPVSALDVSVQAQVLNLLLDMQNDLGLSILFISHDLAVVRYLCTTVCVLQSGRIVEEADRDELFANPRHDYTRQLIDAIPIPDPDLARARAS